MADDKKKKSSYWTCKGLVKHQAIISFSSPVTGIKESHNRRVKGQNWCQVQALASFTTLTLWHPKNSCTISFWGLLLPQNSNHHLPCVPCALKIALVRIPHVLSLIYQIEKKNIHLTNKEGCQHWLEMAVTGVYLIFPSQSYIACALTSHANAEVCSAYMHGLVNKPENKLGRETKVCCEECQATLSSNTLEHIPHKVKWIQ